MGCPPKERLIELAFALVNNEVHDPQTAIRQDQDHVDACDPCKGQLSAYVETIQMARRAFTTAPAPAHTRECLDANLLAGYTDGLLDDETNALVERHLARCEACLRQWLEAAEVAEAFENRPAGVLGYIVGVAEKGVRLLCAPLEGFSQKHAVAGALLGEDAATLQTRKTCRWTQAVGALTLAFSLAHRDRNHVNLSVKVTTKLPPLKPLRFSLWRDDRLVQSELLSAGNSVLLQNLELAAYKAEIAVPSHENVSFEITLESFT